MTNKFFSLQIQTNSPSEEDKKEFFLVMIGELRVLAMQAEYHTLGRLLSAALSELRGGQSWIEAEVRLSS